MTALLSLTAACESPPEHRRDEGPGAETIEKDTMAFGSLTIEFDASGFRPRPWTRLQSAWAAELLTRLPPGNVLELCAGPGQFGLLALEEADRAGGASSGSRRLVQVDTDATACRLAARNAGRAGLTERVEVRHGPAEHSLALEPRFALVIADPPWVPAHRVHDFPMDPPWAIDGGPDGLDSVRSLLPVIERHLLQEGAALLQVGGRDQVDCVRDLLRSSGSTLAVSASREAPDTDNGAVALLLPQDGTTY